MGFELDNFLLDLLIIAFGVVAILNGRRLYWIFVGIGGGVLGLIVTGWVIPEQMEWLHILIMLVLGLGGAWLGRRNNNETMAVRAAAFVLGGFILYFLLFDAGLIIVGTVASLFAILVGGIIGLVLDLVYGDRFLIVISSFCGAALVVAPIEASNAFQAALYSGLAAAGMLLQSREWIDAKIGIETPAEVQ